MTSGSPLVHGSLPLSGWIILDKPVGLGSTQAVGAVKRAVREAGLSKTKVGHGGTLDPLASGVLPIALGEATKLCGRMLDATKAYDFTIRFGEETSTLDAESEVIARSDVRPSMEQVLGVLPQFTGEIEQMPPAYSALKVDGRRAYDLARAGEDVALKSRRIVVHSLSVQSGRSRGPNSSEGEEGLGSAPQGLSTSLEANGLSDVTLSATVSKGTYIRSLARDIAWVLGTVGHVTMLRRTKAGPFTLEQAISLDFLNEAAKSRRLDGAVLPLIAGLDDIPALPIDPEQCRRLQHGQVLFGLPVSPGPYLATDAGRPVALVEVSEGVCKVVRGFNI
ncbi:tRNA pseudouridine(55) synthase TruB [Sphingomonas arenae]|uniref:tRNA pseudouridine(55) synthase TruB n=1 Tax=Sphingomonas arenae TaxID=2812555 RepID=UPI0019680E0A|nr:tRNA pseudouridine(55) synthase TruB [Sphingomonas arenae]